MNQVRKVLVTGGAGYIGSHTCLKLLELGYEVTVIDSLINSNPVVFDRIKDICGHRPEFIHGDIRDRKILQSIFNLNNIDAVMHFAGLKAVGESEQFPLTYYDNNVNGSLTLLEEMDRAGVRTIVFSSSATVYGSSVSVKYDEHTPTNPINVYGRTKLHVENILTDLYQSNSDWKISILRYFNPVGAHPSGLMGEDPKGVPNNLVPFIAQVAAGKRTKLSVFGGDYQTPDGTGFRDYIHVMDLSEGHILALKKLNDIGYFCVNLGTGHPYSVLEVINAFEKVSGRKIPYEITQRRKGDLAEYYANPQLAKDLLNWEAKFDLLKMCEDVWHWQTNNPEGYQVNVN